MQYVSSTAVLKEAGLWHRELAEVSSSTVNGSNTIFVTTHKPLVPSDSSRTSVTTEDVAAYVNGVPRTVTAVNEVTGALTLSSAPANGTEVTIDYCYTTTDLESVDEAIEEASAAIDEAARDLKTIYEADKPLVRRIAKFYAAGLLMSREYGLQSVTEETTKEGERKLDRAEKWLAEYRARLLADAEEEESDTNDAANFARGTENKELFADEYTDTPLPETTTWPHGERVHRENWS